jgi:hypothetical protein
LWRRVVNRSEETSEYESRLLTGSGLARFTGVLCDTHTVGAFSGSAGAAFHADTAGATDSRYVPNEAAAKGTAVRMVTVVTPDVISGRK